MLWIFCVAICSWALQAIDAAGDTVEVIVDSHAAVTVHHRRKENHSETEQTHAASNKTSVSVDSHASVEVHHHQKEKISEAEQPHISVEQASNETSVISKPVERERPSMVRSEAGESHLRLQELANIVDSEQKEADKAASEDGGRHQRDSSRRRVQCWHICNTDHDPDDYAGCTHAADDRKMIADMVKGARDGGRCDEISSIGDDAQPKDICTAAEPCESESGDIPTDVGMCVPISAEHEKICDEEGRYGAFGTGAPDEGEIDAETKNAARFPAGGIVFYLLHGYLLLPLVFIVASCA